MIRYSIIFILFLTFDVTGQQEISVSGTINPADADHVWLKIKDTTYRLPVSPSGFFREKVRGSFNFKRPEHAVLQWGSETLPFLTDTSSLVISHKNNQVILEGGYENRVLTKFRETDRAYYETLKTLTDSGQMDSLKLDRYLKEMELIRTFNTSYVSYNRVGLLLQPSAFSLRKTVLELIHTLDTLSFSSEEKARLISRYEHFVDVETKRQGNILYPELDYTAFREAPGFHALVKQYEYILVDIWATWCGPCIAQHPDLISLAREYRQNKKLTVVGMAVLSPKERWENYLAKKDFGYSNYWLDNANSNLLRKEIRAESLPRYILLRTADKILIEKDIPHESLPEILQKYGR
ncbi:MAG: TlpA family protein disulfide reductase [Leadbetterella sp.]|nr:TlpA family protein disulfide reductase [Leadbetterella sp.]